MASEKVLYIINHLGDSNKTTMRYHQKDLKNQNWRDRVFGKDTDQTRGMEVGTITLENCQAASIKAEPLAQQNYP